MSQEVVLCSKSQQICGQPSCSSSLRKKVFSQRNFKIQRCLSARSAALHCYDSHRRIRRKLLTPAANLASKQAATHDNAPKHVEEGHSHAESGYSESRRVALLLTLGHVGASCLPGKPAAAFPTPSLETLQHSAASSSRCGGDTGISALRNPAIYRFTFRIPSAFALSCKTLNLNGLLCVLQ